MSTLNWPRNFEKVLMQYYRFVESEKWRKEFKLDELVRNFDYTEKEKVFQYYPQYYHKTDKVNNTSFICWLKAAG